MRTKIAVLMLSLFLFVAVMPAFAQDAPVASVNTAYLNVRSGPGLGYGTIATVPRGFGVQLLGRNEGYNWVLIGLTNGVQGWVNVNYVYTTTNISSLPVAENIRGTDIDPAATLTGYVLAEVRTGPNEANPVLATAPIGTNLQLVGRNFDSSWTLVRLPDGTEGWVQSNAVTGTVPVRALSPSDGSVYAPPPPTNTTTTPPTTQNPAPTYQSYVIQPGDTLLSIATAHGVNLYTLASINGIHNINMIYWGQTLWIPS